MFVNNINPIAFSIGGLKIYYYGIIYALGFLIAYFMLPWLARKKNLNIGKGKTADLIMYAVIGDLIGARLFHVIFYKPVYYMQHLLEIFQIWNGGLSFHGALVGIIVAVWLFSRKNKMKFYDLADLLVIPAALALFFGRIANFVNSELVGKVTSVSWCVVFNGYDGCRHPTQIYEAIKNIFVFSVLMFMHGKKLKSGIMFWTFVLMYGSLRFFIEFYKDVGGYFLGLNTGQWLCLPMILLGLFFLIRINRK